MEKTIGKDTIKQYIIQAILLVLESYFFIKLLLFSKFSVYKTFSFRKLVLKMHVLRKLKAFNNVVPLPNVYYIYENVKETNFL